MFKIFNNFSSFSDLSVDNTDADQNNIKINIRDIKNMNTGENIKTDQNNIEVNQDNIDINQDNIDINQNNIDIDQDNIDINQDNMENIDKHPKYHIPYFRLNNLTIKELYNNPICGYECDIGGRTYNEDTYIIRETPYGKIYGVLDGHGLMPHKIIDIINNIIINYRDTGVVILKRISSTVEHFISSDEGQQNGYFRSGTTVSLIILHNNQWTLGYLADSSVLQLRKFNNKYEPIAITEDHNPDNEKENKRVIANDGTIIYGRVNGIINITRSWGVYSIKQISHDLEIYPFEVQKEDILIIASDGLWRIISNSEDLMNMINEMTKYLNPTEQANFLIQYANSQYSNDNITAIVIHI